MTTTRPIMSRSDLAKHLTSRADRNYSISGDGYDDMDLARRNGWSLLPSWGRDGWDLGNWPYVSMQVRNTLDFFELQIIVEGEATRYAFDTLEDREAAIDYLFLWYAAGQDWAPLSYEDRARLDAGELTIDPKFRGPFRIDRLETP